MPKISEIKQSKFLTRADCNPPVLLTIAGVSKQNVAMQNEAQELKWCLAFHEVAKPLVLNSINGDIIAKFTGTEEMNEWVNHKVVLYDDPNISFGGKLVGGIRARAPRTAQVPVRTMPMAEQVPPSIRAAAEAAIAQRNNRPDDPRPIGEFMPAIRPTDQRQVAPGGEEDPF